MLLWKRQREATGNEPSLSHPDLEIALSGRLSEDPAPTSFFSPAEDKVKLSDDVIEGTFYSIPDSRIWDFSPMRLGAAETQPQLHPALLRLSAMISQYFTRMACGCVGAKTSYSVTTSDDTDPQVELSKRRESLRFSDYALLTPFACGCYALSIQGCRRRIVGILYDFAPETAKVEKLHRDVTC